MCDLSPPRAASPTWLLRRLLSLTALLHPSIAGYSDAPVLHPSIAGYSDAPVFHPSVPGRRPGSRVAPRTALGVAAPAFDALGSDGRDVRRLSEELQTLFTALLLPTEVRRLAGIGVCRFGE